jgi:mono/diheme cytochrome c family protein
MIRLSIVVLLTSTSFAAEWAVPSAASQVVNPAAGAPIALTRGKKLYAQYCITCHGATGTGDGAGAAGLDPKPRSFADPAVVAESDGALYWKITTGRGSMPPWKGIIPERQIWETITYMRSLVPTPAKP